MGTSELMSVQVLTLHTAASPRKFEVEILGD